MKGFKLGSWQVRPELNAIFNGEEVRIEPQVMEVLCLLARRPGGVVSKDELIEEVWQGRFVGEEVITNAIWELRRALGDNARRPTFIQTIPKKGYRLIAPVGPLEGGESAGQESATVGSAAVGWAAVGSGAVESGAVASSARGDEDGGPSSRSTRSRQNASGLASLKQHPLRLAAAAAGLLLAVALFVFPGFLTRSDADSDQPFTLAVLPFQALGTEAYFAEGLSGAVAGELARFPHFRVIARDSAGNAADGPARSEDIAQRLNARALIQGTVQRQSSQVRLTLQLADSADGTFFWSQPFEQEDSRLPLLILQAAQEAARQLAVHYAAVPQPGAQLTDEIEAMRRRPAVDRQAIEDHLRGVHFWKRRSHGGLLRAVEYFEKAIERAPEFADAYAGLANAHIILADHFYAPSEPSLEKAHDAAQKALQLDPENPQALTAMAWILWVRDWDWEGAEELFRRALRHNPSYATGHQWFAAMLEVAERSQEAEFHAGEAQWLDILSPIVHTSAGTVAWQRGQTDEARRDYQKALQIDPRFAEAHKGLFWEALQREDLQTAFNHCLIVQQQVLENDDWRPYVLRFQLGDVCQPDRMHQQGLREGEFRILEERLKQRQERGLFISPFTWLELYASAGRVQQASYWLRAAVNAKSRHLFYLPKYLEDRENVTILRDPLLAAELNRIPLPQPRD